MKVAVSPRSRTTRRRRTRGSAASPRGRWTSWGRWTSRGRWWKLLGLAGLAGVAATGVVTVRAERRRAGYSPDEVRARLRERAVAAGAVSPPGPPSTVPPGP